MNELYEAQFFSHFNLPVFQIEYTKMLSEIAFPVILFCAFPHNISQHIFSLEFEKKSKSSLKFISQNVVSQNRLLFLYSKGSKENTLKGSWKLRQTSRVHEVERRMTRLEEKVVYEECQMSRKHHSLKESTDVMSPFDWIVESVSFRWGKIALWRHFPRQYK